NTLIDTLILFLYTASTNQQRQYPKLICREATVPTISRPRIKQRGAPRSFDPIGPGSRLGIHSFSLCVRDRPVEALGISLPGSLLLWLGERGDPRLSALAVALATRLDTMPIGSSLLGDHAEGFSCALAQRLAKRTGKQVFASVNLPGLDPASLALLEQQLRHEMEQRPDRF
uniref:Proteasome assembly chaperone 4 n=1 Tax=Petromyzon marinus TaxID=7757 RepID=A0AAJ7WK96_PETMA